MAADLGGGNYAASVPANTPAGLYTFKVYQNASPTIGDAVLFRGSIDWDGGAIASLGAYFLVDGVPATRWMRALLAFIGAKVSTVTNNGDGTSTIVYYRQDGVTAVLTLTFNNVNGARSGGSGIA